MDPASGEASSFRSSSCCSSSAPVFSWPGTRSTNPSSTRSSRNGNATRPGTRTGRSSRSFPREVNRISGLAKILKNDTDIVYGLFHYSGTRGDAKPLKLAMNQLFPKMNLSFFVMTDPDGKVLYRAGKSKGAEPGALAETNAFRKALKGEGCYGDVRHRGVRDRRDRPDLRIRKGPARRNADPRHPSTNDFVAKIARETGSQAFIATSEKVIAGSYDPSLTNAFDPALAQLSRSGSPSSRSTETDIAPTPMSRCPSSTRNSAS